MCYPRAPCLHKAKPMGSGCCACLHAFSGSTVHRNTALHPRWKVKVFALYAAPFDEVSMHPNGSALASNLESFKIARF